MDLEGASGCRDVVWDRDAIVQQAFALFLRAESPGSKMGESVA